MTGEGESKYLYILFGFLDLIQFFAGFMLVGGKYCVTCTSFYFLASAQSKSLN